MDNEKLCLELIKADSERQVVSILQSYKLWESSENWKYYGNNENNFSTIGNQQSKPEAALVEKLINSVDAVLMAECYKAGIQPESHSAPQSISEALMDFFKIHNGKLSNVDITQRRKLADRIMLIATGKKSNPSYTIIDTGEGQAPDHMEDTLLSIGRSNKLRIPFVQGKFNMGGTGVLQFCGKMNLQLIVSKRNSDISNEASEWGMTVVKRVDPVHGTRSSSYKYLAPGKKILTFKSDVLKVLPSEYPEPYGKDLEYGTLIKLYEYQIGGMRTNILFDLYNRLSLLMPGIALPVRLYERRQGYKGHTFETTLSGLTVRLEEDKRDNIEEGFPTSSSITIEGQQMSVLIYAFKKNQAKKYIKNEGVVFSINGQTHGFLTRSFFIRHAVKMSYIADSLLILVDCSSLTGRSREDLFMNSRDRLRSGELRATIENSLEDLLRNHSGLKELREKRRREDVEDKIQDSKPLEDIVKDILIKSPTLSKLFIDGVRIPNPFKSKKTDKKEEFEGKQFPSYFNLIKKYTKDKPKISSPGVRLRIQYTTDVKNDYLDRINDPGEFNLFLNDDKYNNFSVSFWNGTVTLNIQIPRDTKIGTVLCFRSEVSDITRTVPFSEEFCIDISTAKTTPTPGPPGGRKPSPSNKPGNDSDSASYLDLPHIIEVSETEWSKYGFTSDTALKVKDSGDDGYDFFINKDNIHLLTEIKSGEEESSKIMSAQYKYGMVLIGLAILKSNIIDTTNNEDFDIYDEIDKITQSLSPVLLPLISGLSDIRIEDSEETIDDMQD